jgi:predicted permease
MNANKMNGMAMVFAFGNDIRYALRGMRLKPGFTAVAVASLALGIGAASAIFTLTDAILLRPLPVANPQELVMLAHNPGEPVTGASYPDYLYLRDHSRSYAGLIALWSGGVTRFGASRLVALALVSGNYFQVLGVRPQLGRVFNSTDNERPGGHPYVVLSDPFWREAFGADATVVGRDILLNGTHFEIVGVAARGFTGTNVGVAPQVFAPIVMERTFYRNDVEALNTRDAGWITIMGRLRSGVSRGSAESELNVLWRQILANDPGEAARRSRQKNYDRINTRLLLPGSAGDSRLRRHVSGPLMILMIASGFVLLIACANVANLVAARGLARQKEIAVRLAVGARRGRLLLQMLTESLTLSALGTVAGLPLAWLGVRVLLRFLPNDALSPLHLDLMPDRRFLAFAFALTVLSGVAFGLAPALRASGQDLVTALKGDARGRGRRWNSGRVLVALQVALCLLLLAGAGLFARTLSNLRAVDLGLKRGTVLFVDTNMTQSGYRPRQAQTYFEKLRQEVARLPGVQAASMAVNNPFGNTGWQERVMVEGPADAGEMDINAVTPRFFEATGIPLLRGRDFLESEGDGSAPRAAIVNESFARRVLGGDPIGKRVCLGRRWVPAEAYEIVGVVANARYESFVDDVRPMIYRPFYRDMTWTGGVLCVRTGGDAGGTIRAIRERAQSIDPAVMVTEARTLEENLDLALLEQRFVATLGGFFGAVALLLAAVGIYGVMSQAVMRRTREIGIRMALGADAGSVRRMVLRDSLAMLTAGAAVGLPSAMALSGSVKRLLFGVKPQDPATIAGAVLVLLVVTVLAGWIPAQRATRVHPLQALKQD